MLGSQRAKRRTDACLTPGATWRDRERVFRGSSRVSWLVVGVITVPAPPRTVTLGKLPNRSGPQFAHP